MVEKIKAGTILIEESTALPDSLQFESEQYPSGWRLVKDLDRYGLDRKIREAGWTFFFMAGEVKTSVFGFDAEKRTLKAIHRLLANLKSEQLNCLEITQVALKHFLGLPYVTVSAHSRHIQENMFLSRARHFAEWELPDSRRSQNAVSLMSLPSEVKTIGIA